MQAKLRLVVYSGAPLTPLPELAESFQVWARIRATLHLGLLHLRRANPSVKAFSARTHLQPQPDPLHLPRTFLAPAQAVAQVQVASFKLLPNSKATYLPTREIPQLLPSQERSLVAKRILKRPVSKRQPQAQRLSPCLAGLPMRLAVFSAARMWSLQ